MAADRIEKQARLGAPLERVWRAISDAREFGAWFGMSFDGPFVAGQPVSGRLTPTQVDKEVARLQAPHAGLRFEFMVELIEPPLRLVLGWHPFAIDPAVDYSAEPMTRIEFRLEDADGGTTRLTITESGFERLPPERRAAAFEANSGGWSHQLRLIEKYLN
ncbi:MAG: SRPBCC family protein [Terriglobales bacterium]